MNILWNLSARHLRLHRKRTAITVIGILLSVAMVTAISGMIVSFQDMFYRDSVEREGLWHVRYYGLSEETMEKVAAEPVFSVSEAVIGSGDEPCLQLQFAKLRKSIFDESETICARYGIERDRVQYHNNLLIAKGIVPGGYYEALYGFAAVLLTLVAAGSVMVIGNAFSISAAERSRQFGLLKSAGATKGQVRDIVLLEGVVLAALGIPLGILGGFFAEWVALSIANRILYGMLNVNMKANFRVVVSPETIAIAVIAALVTIFLSAWFPARRAARCSAIEAIRQTEEIKIRPRSVRVSPLAGKLFGFEGTLAAKTMKRNRRRYRTTVLSLVVSITLFIGVSSFGDMLKKATSMAYEDYGSNIAIAIWGEDKERQDLLADEITSWEGGQVHTYRYNYGYTDVPEQYMARDFLDAHGAAGGKSVYLYSLSDADFEALCGSLRLDPATLRDPANPAGILINTTGTYIVEGKRYDRTPFTYRPGDAVDFEPDEESDDAVGIAIAGIVDEIPDGLGIRFNAMALNMVVSEEVRASLQAENGSDFINLSVMAENSAAFSQRVETLLEKHLEQNTWFVTDYEGLAENNRHIHVLVMIFIYGFIAMLSLIGVTNVITTISTGIALRRKEFAMLRSVGITQKGLAKILTCENIIYGAKALVIGIVMGNLASYLMYYYLDGAMSFAYIWPVTSMIVSVVAVVLLVSATTAFASHRQKKDNIVAALREDVA